MSQQTFTTWQNSLRLFLMIFSICCGSLLLLVYVGYGEVQRTYPKFVVGKLVAQAEIIRAPLESHLRAGLPIEQFPGFRQFGDRVRASDQSIHSIFVSTRAGDVAFEVGAPGAPALRGLAEQETSSFLTQRDESWLQVFLPLHDRFSTVGALGVTVSRAEIEKALWERFALFLPLSLVIALVCALVVVALDRRDRRGRWTAIIFAAAFLFIAALVLQTLVSIYSEGAQAKARALSDSLRERFEPVFAFALTLEDFEGLTQVFDQYRQLDPDIRSISLNENGVVRLNLDPAMVGKPWRADEGSYEFSSALGGERKLNVSVTLPMDAVIAAVSRSAKNFLALFLGVALISTLFLKLSRTLTRGHDVDASENLLTRLTPVFFIAVFVESLSAGFLPQLITSAAQEHGLLAAAASLTFSAYFISFLLTVLPGPQLTDRFGERGLMIAGVGLACASMLVMAAPLGFAAMVFARVLAGAGQACLLVGTQSYILKHVAASKRTRGASIIVLGFNGGLVAGAAIGSLLVNSIGPNGVFLTGAAVIAVNLLLVLALLPSAATRVTGVGLMQALASVAHNFRETARSYDFWRTLAFVGAPSKAVLTGIVGFLMPLTLAKMSFLPEDIGQLIMLYPLGVLAATPWAARHVDGGGSSDSILFAGMCVSGISMLLVGAAALSNLFAPDLLPLSTLAIGAGLTLLGVGHGLINAPVITHVANSDAATRLGATQVASLYRLLERLGHALGPALAGQLLVLSGFGLGAVSLAGAVTLTLGLLFIAIRPRAQEAT